MKSDGGSKLARWGRARVRDRRRFAVPEVVGSVGGWLWATGYGLWAMGYGVRGKVGRENCLLPTGYARAGIALAVGRPPVVAPDWPVRCPCTQCLVLSTSTVRPLCPCGGGGCPVGLSTFQAPTHWILVPIHGCSPRENCQSICPLSVPGLHIPVGTWNGGVNQNTGPRGIRRRHLPSL